MPHSRTHAPMTQTNAAIIRRQISRIPGVSRTWFEWTSEVEGLAKTLVVEVDFDTDPNSIDHEPETLYAIEDTAKRVYARTSMVISALKIVPKQVR